MLICVFLFIFAILKFINTKQSFFQLSFAGCGGLIDATLATSGRFAHPSYPLDYTSSQSCEYIIRTAPGKKITLDFEFFNLEGASDCRYDSLDIHDGELVSDRLVGKYCGPRDLKDIKSTGNALFLKFTSDTSTQDKGFLARWRVDMEALTTTKKTGKVAVSLTVQFPI